MDVDKNELISILKKKAMGFSYEEISREFERMKPKKYLFCEKRKRIYVDGHFLKVNPTIKKGEVVEVKPKKYIKFCVPLFKFKAIKKIDTSF